MMTRLPEIGEQPYSVESVAVEVADATYDENGNPISAVYVSRLIKKIHTHTGYAIKTQTNKYLVAGYTTDNADLMLSSKYVNDIIFSENIMPIIGYEYYPATVHLTLGDPRLEGSDVLFVADVDGTEYVVPCHQITHAYTNTVISDITSATANNKANDIGTAMPITARLDKIERKTDASNQTADNAMKIAGNNNQYFWFTGSGEDTGAHITETPQEQFLSDPENGGGNLLARSNGVAIRDGLDELATFSATQLRIGKPTSNRAMINNDSLQMYDTNNAKYFEVSASGMSYGTKTVATTDDVDAVEEEVQGAVSSASVKTQYYLSTSDVSAIGGSWQDTVPTWTTGKYIWTRVATTKTTIGGTSTTTYSTEVYDSALTTALSTSKGADEKADGSASTVTTTPQYYLSTSNTSATGGSWGDTSPTWTTGKYIWSRYKIVKTTVGGTATTSYTTEVYDKALTDALSSAEDASKVATNYLYFDSTTGLAIAEASPSTATKKVQIDANGIKLPKAVWHR